jgi:hypothetical protein
MSDCNCGSSFRRYSTKVRNFVTVILEKPATVVSGFSTIPEVFDHQDPSVRYVILEAGAVCLMHATSTFIYKSFLQIA